MSDVQGRYDVVVVGAGPSGSLVSTLLVDKGYRVLILEKEFFPRFSIGESLLPQSMAFLEQASMLQAVVEAGFQFKNGAAFCQGEKYDFFDFREKFSSGWGTTYQVQRDHFDKVLADCAEARGVTIKYGQTVQSVKQSESGISVDVQSHDGGEYRVDAEFLLDASGFGRVLPRLLNLEKTSTLASRVSLFTHIEDNITHPQFDRNKILITVHPEHSEIWYWLIPFSNGRASVGVVLPRDLYARSEGSTSDILQEYISQGCLLNDLLGEACFDTPVGLIDGYSADVESLFGDRFALLGNAGEFLDPVFSSGVTIALKSASLAAEVLHKQLQGEQPCWETEYAMKLRQGVDTFRAFVEGWYDGRLQDVIFAERKSEEIKQLISSILAGYAWDTENPYVRDPSRLTTLAKLCQN